MIGSRSSGLIDGADSGASTFAASGPRPSSGRPARRRRARAFPADRQPFRARERIGDGAASSGHTRAPGNTPATSVVGIRNRRSPEKPTTSACAYGSVLPGGSSIVHSAPTDSRRPIASSTSPPRA
jgi:hypothetical protein